MRNFWLLFLVMIVALAGRAQMPGAGGGVWLVGPNEEHPALLPAHTLLPVIDRAYAVTRRNGTT